MPLPRSARTGPRSAAYNRVQNQDEEHLDTPVIANTETPSSTTLADSTSLLDGDEHDVSSLRDNTTLDEKEETSKVVDENDENALKLIILDPAHNRFTVVVHRTGTVADLKQIGSKVHKVPAKSQRLIYRGKLLDDDATLHDVGLTEPETILHLFPKPRVVVQSSSVDAASSFSCNEDNEDEDDSSTTGAHIPQIVLDPDEAEQRASILVLGSDEILEAQNNVKMLSFLLLVICSMELLALFTIMMGAPAEEPYPNSYNGTTGGNSTNNTTPESASDDYFSPPPLTVRIWHTSDYFDLVISSMGLYVAILGIKATTENTMRLAKRYLIGVIATGIAWNIFYYFMNVQAEKKNFEDTVQRADDDQIEVPSNAQFYTTALVAMILPSLIWFLCCVRAWQFHQLLREAEEEAGERIRNEISDLEQGGAMIVGDTSSLGGRTIDAAGDGDAELTLQNESATIA